MATDRSSSCVFIANRGPEGLTRLDIIPPLNGLLATATDTILFDKTKFGLDTILRVSVSYHDDTSQATSLQALLTLSGNNVTITLPAVPYGLSASDLVTYVSVIGTSRTMHSSGGNRLLGGGQI